MLGIETRGEDHYTIARVRAALHDGDAADRVAAERAFLARLGGGCQTPLAAHAVLDGDELTVTGLVARPDGSQILKSLRKGPRADAEALGRALAEDLIDQGGAQIIADLLA